MGGETTERDQLSLPGFALDVVRGCRTALASELDAVRERGDRFALRMGRILHRSPSTTYFVFEAVMPRHLGIGTRGQLTLAENPGAAAFPVELVAINDNTIVLASDTAKVGDSQRDELAGTVELSSAWLLEALDSRLHDCELGGGDDSLVEALLSHDLGEYPDPPREDLSEPSYDFDSAAQSGQALAARSALEPGLRFVWGPPGTGKTTVLAETVRLALEEGRRVLVLAHSNVAVDVAMERISETVDAEALTEGRVLRVGFPVLDSVLSNNALLPSQIASRQNPDVGERLKAIESTLIELASSARADTGNGASIAGQISALRTERAELSQKIDAAERNLIDRADVIGTTIAKLTVSDQLWDWSKDLVIVDEASMVGMPTVLAIALRGAITLSFFGDFRQLPPVAVSRSERARTWVGQDVFDFAGVREAQEAGEPDARTAVLTVQFRMSEGVCAAVNEFAYGGLLRTHPSARNRGIRLADLGPCEGDELVIVDTSGFGTRGEVEAAPDSFSRCNLVSAGLSVALGEALSRSGLSVGLLSPYRAQAEIMAALCGDVSGVDAATAHRFQGGERDAIVVDLVDALPLDGPSKLTGKDPELALRLLNVAASRARGRLFVVADLDFLHEHHPLNSRALRLIHDARDAGASIVPAAGLVADLATGRELSSSDESVQILPSLVEGLARSAATGGPVEANFPTDEIWTDDLVGVVRTLVSNGGPRPLIRTTPRSARLIEDLDVELALATCGSAPFIAAASSMFTIATSVNGPAFSFDAPAARGTVHRIFGVEQPWPT